MINRTKFVFVIIVVLFIGALLLVWRYSQTQNDNLTRVAELSRQGTVALGQGNYEEAVKNYKSALSLAPNKDVEAQNKLKLGQALMTTRKAEAMEVFKEIAADTSFDKGIRARAVNLMAQELSATHDTVFASKYIFTGDPYASFLVNNDFELAELKLREYSLSIYPTATPAFRVALWYINELSQNRNSALDQKTEEEFKNQVRKYYQLGSELLLNESGQGGIFEQANAIGQQGLVLGYLASIGEKDPSEVEKLYEMALEMISLHPSDVNLKNLGFYLRFHYAAVLKNLHGESRNDAIKKILMPFTPQMTKNTYFEKFLASENDPLHGQHHHHQDIIDLAAISPEFKLVAESAGWKF